jgi:hypothetical protein
MDWIKKVTGEAEISFSVCTGAFPLAETGLLNGIEATTHWSSVERLRATYPDARIVGDRRVIDTGSVVTTAGVSAGIDGALHLVARLLGEEVAVQTARVMEYDRRPVAGTAQDAAITGAKAGTMFVRYAHSAAISYGILEGDQIRQLDKSPIDGGTPTDHITQSDEMRLKPMIIGGITHNPAFSRQRFKIGKSLIIFCP